MDPSELLVYDRVQEHVRRTLQDPAITSRTDAPSTGQKAIETLLDHLPEHGRGLEATTDHILQDLTLAFNGSSLSPTYYGFVTGGVTPAARIADNLVTLYDQNVQVHLPNETAATNVEDRAGLLLLELFHLTPTDWPVHAFTTGATAGNILGMVCGREYVINQRLASLSLPQQSGEGLLSASIRAGIRKFQVLTTLPHSSLGKAASIVGLGSSSVVDVALPDQPLHFDFARLEALLSEADTVSIVVISCGEVNTGSFATRSRAEVCKLRDLCHRFKAWLHVDAAFGFFAHVLPTTTEYDVLRAGTEGLELADSVAGDGHKLLNVPYDCGFFFSRHRDISTQACQNTNAAYLSSDGSALLSPLNMRLENSARFRGLPVYATLLAYGRSGYSAMVARMVDLARKVSLFIEADCSHLELLHPDHRERHPQWIESVYMCVLFRARDDKLNAVLAERIKATGVLYGSGTTWLGKPATRFAIAKWNVDVERDLAIVKDVLRSLV